jgi:uncharacterized protein YjbI with pentapeptide repeats
MPPRKTDGPPRRETPSLPEAADLEPLGAAVLLAGETVRDARLREVDSSGRRIPQSRIFGSVMEKCAFQGAAFSSARWGDVRIIDCDLSNCVFHSLEARRVEFINCRMTGVKASGSRLQDVLFEGCDLKYAVLRESSVVTCEFVSSQMAEADLTLVRASGASFRQCSLSAAEISHSVWRECDLRGAVIEGIILGGADLKTSTVTAAQAIELAVLMGLRIG